MSNKLHFDQIHAALVSIRDFKNIFLNKMFLLFAQHLKVLI